MPRNELQKKKNEYFIEIFYDFIGLKMRELLDHAKAENWDCTVDASQASHAENDMGKVQMGSTSSYKNDKGEEFTERWIPFPFSFSRFVILFRRFYLYDKSLIQVGSRFSHDRQLRRR